MWSSVVEMLIVSFSILATTYILDMLFCREKQVKSLCWIDVLISEFQGTKKEPSRLDVVMGISIGILLAGIVASLMNVTISHVILKKKFSIIEVISGVVSYGSAIGVAMYLVPYLFQKESGESGSIEPQGGSPSETNTDEWINLAAGVVVGMGVYFTMTRVLNLVK